MFTNLISNLPDWVKKIAGLIAALITLIVLLRQTHPTGIIVFGIVAYIFLVFAFAFVAFARTPPLVSEGKGPYRYDRYRHFALAGIAFLCILGSLLFMFSQSRSFILSALWQNSSKFKGDILIAEFDLRYASKRFEIARSVATHIIHPNFSWIM